MALSNCWCMLGFGIPSICNSRSTRLDLYATLMSIDKTWNTSKVVDASSSSTVQRRMVLITVVEKPFKLCCPALIFGKTSVGLPVSFFFTFGTSILAFKASWLKISLSTFVACAWRFLFPSVLFENFKTVKSIFVTYLLHDEHHGPWSHTLRQFGYSALAEIGAREALVVEVDLGAPGVTPRVDLTVCGAAVVISRHHSAIH